MKRLTLALCAALVAAFSLPAVAAPAAKTAKTANAPAKASAKTVAAQEVDYYTCPMHADVRAAKPGKCPKCGMELTPVFKKK